MHTAPDKRPGASAKARAIVLDIPDILLTRHPCGSGGPGFLHHLDSRFRGNDEKGACLQNQRPNIRNGALREIYQSMGGGARKSPEAVATNRGRVVNEVDTFLACGKGREISGPARPRTILVLLLHVARLGYAAMRRASAHEGSPTRSHPERRHIPCSSCK
jgi:hypothetical protein